MNAIDAASNTAAAAKFEERIGHPPGLFVLFFAEMWERFSYYGMRALLVFYMMKGFLGYGDTKAYAVYGAYTALVYATPFIGGMLADRVLGARRAVVIGGLLMAAGHLLMTLETSWTFYGALGLLICGNGFFKPNVSTMVGGLYPHKPEMRDSAFTIFYMGINLGAAMSGVLCGWIGEKYGWHWGFGLATLGMLVGLAVFVAPARITQILILGGATAAAGTMIWNAWGNLLVLVVNVPLSAALLVAAGFAAYASTHGSLPADVGQPPDPEAPKREVFAGLSAQKLIFLGIVVTVPIFALLVRNDTIAGVLLSIFGVVALGVIVLEMFRGTKVERHRLVVVLILMFFSMLFWAFFEQAGSSVNTFTDRNVDRVVSSQVITEADVGKTLDVELTQAQLGREIDPALLPKAALEDVKQGSVGRVVFTLDMLEAARKQARESSEPVTVKWRVTESDVGMKIATARDELPASIFQSANPMYILMFGLVFSALWAFLARRRLEPSTPVKFGLGLLQLGLGFGALWYGAQTASAQGMVWIGWLLLGYLLHTTGELCLSPVGLSMVTKLSPARIVSTVMGGWFLATAFSNFIAAIIAQLTGVSHGEEGSGAIPPPTETVHVYGDVFGSIAVAAVISSVIVFVISPLLRKWMHEEEGFSTSSQAGEH